MLEIEGQFLEISVLGFCVHAVSLYYRVVVIRAPLEVLCYTVRDAVNRFCSPTTQMVPERFQPQPFAVLLIS
jgi:hypothetical protein